MSNANFLIPNYIDNAHYEYLSCILLVHDVDQLLPLGVRLLVTLYDPRPVALGSKVTLT